MSDLRDRTARFVDHPRFQNAIIILIVINAITLGLETSPTVMSSHGDLVSNIDRVILGIFVLEIALKMFARGIIGFFKNGWNIFDFVIVGVALMPTTGSLSALRAFRILRTFRLLSVVPQMRKVVQALLSAIPGMLSIVTLIALIFYVFAVITTKLFAATFPEWFGHIGASMYTLFQIMTLESWSMGIVRPVMAVHSWAWLLFVPFILITSFAVLNLFIGIIVDSMQTIHAEQSDMERQKEENALQAELRQLREDVADLRALIDRNRMPE